ncbi:MAG: S1C family serine protease [Kofleriaceae bacterium]
MRRRVLLGLVGLVGAVGLTSCGSTPDPHSPRMRMTPKDIVQQSSDGIVRIEAGTDKVGTGFILDSSGLVATNLHVVAGEEQIKVKLHDGTTHQVMQVASYDPSRDLALLRIAPPGKVLKPLRLGDSDQMTAGDQVVAIGNPLGVFDYSVTEGLVSQVRTLCTENEIVTNPETGEKVERSCPPGGFSLLQISAAISQGSSGGPLFNQFGEVIGVTTAIINAGQSINLAVPAKYLKPMVRQSTAISMTRFADETRSEERDTEGSKVTITRQVPQHPLTVLDGCSEQQIVEVVEAITSAIDVGAPLYNRGDIEACFRIYEGTSSKLERDPPCKGVGKAFGDGLLRASTLATYKEKAWALRDTFDGLIDVAAKRGVKPGKP